MTTPARYFRTIRHLTLRQVVYQVWNRVRPKPRLRWEARETGNVPDLIFPITFTYLNQSVTFAETIDWNFADNGKLWTYNLTYFGDLTHRPVGEGLALIHDFIRQTNHLRDALEPYPTSLRLLNWRAFLLREKIRDDMIRRHLYAQTALLRSRLEYHLGGNHLLENACALLTMGLHFQQHDWVKTGTALLRQQLTEQILPDGGHYERSPVYHQLLTGRLLDLCEVLADPARPPGVGEVVDFVRSKTAAMLNWLVAITFRNGDVPMVNDSAYGVAPTTANLLSRARDLGFSPIAARLAESGYRMLTTSRFELFIDVGPVGPDHQPGHAHADTFSFVLHIDGTAFVVDPGTSTYQPGKRRTWERSTAAHNTVTLNGLDSSEVWGGFRVGRRAQVKLLTDTPRVIEASHDGYGFLGSTHRRRWEIGEDDTLSIYDSVDDKKNMKRCRVYLYDCLYLTNKQLQLKVNNNDVFIRFDSVELPEVSTYQLATGFNQAVAASCLSVPFAQTLTTTITLRP